MGNEAAALLLKASDLFGKLSADALKQLVDIGYTRSVKRQETLYLQGDRGNILYLIIAGEVRISANSAQGQELHLNTLGSGDVMGEIALLDGGPRTATATAVNDGVVFCIERPEFVRLLGQHPAISIQLLKLVCDRVRWTSTLLEDSAFLPTKARLAKRLLYLAQHSGGAVDDGWEIRLSQTDLARYLNLTRQVVNRFLQQLQNDQIIAIGRNRVIIRDQAALLQRTLPESAGA